MKSFREVPVRYFKRPREGLKHFRRRFRTLFIEFYTFSGGSSFCRRAALKLTVSQRLPLKCHAITLKAGAILKERFKPSSGRRGNLGGILGDTFGKSNCESKICSEVMPLGSLLLPRAFRCLASPIWKLEKGVHKMGVHDHCKF